MQGRYINVHKDDVKTLSSYPCKPTDHKEPLTAECSETTLTLMAAVLGVELPC